MLSQEEKNILSLINESSENLNERIETLLQCSQEAASQRIEEFVKKGWIDEKENKYFLKSFFSVEKTLQLEGLEEHKVWEEFISKNIQQVPKNIYDIARHVFSEMLNNAIDHSESSDVLFGFEWNALMLDFYIADSGIGIFRKVKKALNLASEEEAILELGKGKFTTDSARHSGEGVFFSSKMCDKFSILSYGNGFFHAEKEGDVALAGAVGKVDHEGTFVLCRIFCNTVRTTKEVFDEFTDPETFEFTKTHIPLFLLMKNIEGLVSRSQAKRVLSRLENFKEIKLDFKGVESIGQAFADEIFRVWARQNPTRKIVYTNASSQVVGMIKRAQGNDL